MSSLAQKTFLCVLLFPSLGGALGRDSPTRVSIGFIFRIQDFLAAHHVEITLVIWSQKGSYLFCVTHNEALRGLLDPLLDGDLVARARIYSVGLTIGEYEIVTLFRHFALEVRQIGFVDLVFLNGVLVTC